MNFNEIQLNSAIFKAVTEQKFTELTPIQEKVIPLVLSNKDVLGCAKTGSGKTAAYALPIIETLVSDNNTGIRALILAPTRELVLQISKTIGQFAVHTKLKTLAVYGGVDIKPQMDALTEGVDILVAAPGRLLDLYKQGYVDFSQVRIFTLDEADRMLDMGFLPDIKAIIKKLTGEHQTLMFSATMPKPIERLADTIMKDPETVMADSVTQTTDLVKQLAYYVDEENKMPLLLSLVKSEEVKNAIVFTNTKQKADFVMKELLKRAVRVLAIHGDKSQNARQDALTQFKKGRIKVLVATDVAARGIDVNELSHVINYDIPDNCDSYIHRIGRTGRANMTGIAINFISIDDYDAFEEIKAQNKKCIQEVKSDWPMKNFTRTVKKKVDRTPEPIVVSKVKDVSLSGKAVDKKSNNRYRKDRFAKPGQKRSKW